MAGDRVVTFPSVQRNNGRRVIQQEGQWKRGWHGMIYYVLVAMVCLMSEVKDGGGTVSR